MTDATATERTTDLVLIEAFDRAIRTQAAWHSVVHPVARPTARVEQTAKALAKDLSKRITETVQDRHARNQARIELYNLFLPVLLDISERHSRERARLHVALWVMSAVTALAVVVGYLI